MAMAVLFPPDTVTGNAFYSNYSIHSAIGLAYSPYRLLVFKYVLHAFLFGVISARHTLSSTCKPFDGKAHRLSAVTHELG